MYFKDLVDDDVMFLDSGDEVYIWIGKDSTPEETGQALDLAKNYLDTDPTERYTEGYKIVSTYLLLSGAVTTAPLSLLSKGKSQQHLRGSLLHGNR